MRIPVSPCYLLVVATILLCGCASDRYWVENDTKAKLDNLGGLIRVVNVGQLKAVKDYGDLLRLMRSKIEPEKDDAPEKFFRNDGWNEPFLFEKRSETNALIFVISSTHLDHDKRPLSLTVTVTDDNKLTFSRSWKN
jgi:hypothetical protein